MKAFPSISNTSFFLALFAAILGSSLSSCNLDTIDPTSPHAGKLEKVIFSYTPAGPYATTKKDSIGFTYNANGKTSVYKYSNPSQTFNILELAQKEAFGESYVISSTANGFTAYAEGNGESIRQTLTDTTIQTMPAVRHSLQAHYTFEPYHDVYSTSSTIHLQSPNELRNTIFTKEAATDTPTERTQNIKMNLIEGTYNADRVKIANAFILSTLYGIGFDPNYMPDLGTPPLTQSLLPALNMPLFLSGFDRVAMPIYVMDSTKTSGGAYLPTLPIQSISYGDTEVSSIMYVADQTLVYSITITQHPSWGYDGFQLSMEFFWY